MNGAKAKLLRKMAYDDDFSCRFREYQKDIHGCIVADKRRNYYQALKKSVLKVPGILNGLRKQIKLNKEMKDANKTT